MAAASRRRRPSRRARPGRRCKRRRRKNEWAVSWPQSTHGRSRMMHEVQAMAIPDEVRQWRKAQRARLLAAREAIPPEVRRAHNEAITGRLIQTFPQLAAMTIGFYWPLRGEFDARV